MNAQILKQTSVTPTLCVTTLKDPTAASVLVDIRVMVKTAQVNISRICLFSPTNNLDIYIFLLSVLTI